MDNRGKLGVLGERVMLVMTQIKKQMRASLQKVAIDEGLSHNEIEVLLFLSRKEHDTARDIARARGLSPSLVSKSVDQLLRRGYIEARQDENDRRVAHLLLLPKAAYTVETLNNERNEFFDALCRGITMEEANVFESIVSKMSENIKEYGKERNG